MALRGLGVTWPSQLSSNAHRTFLAFYFHLQHWVKSELTGLLCFADEEEDEDDFPVTLRRSSGTAQNAQSRAGDGQASPSPQKIKFGGREWDEPRSISATRGNTQVGGQTRGRHQTRPFKDLSEAGNSDFAAESGAQGRDRARGMASEPSDSARRSVPESVQQPPRNVLSREEARRRDDALMQQRSWWGGGGRGSALYGDEYDGRTKGKAWDGASIRQRDTAAGGRYQGIDSEGLTNGRERRSRGIFSEGASLRGGNGEGEVGWDGGTFRQRRGSAQDGLERKEEWAPQEPLRGEERLRGSSQDAAFSGGQVQESVAERDDLADIMDSICGPETDVQPQVLDGRDTTTPSNFEDSSRGGIGKTQFDQPWGGSRGRYEERPAEWPARSGRDGERIDASQKREGSSSRRGVKSPGSFSARADTGFESWANGASEVAVGLGAESILAEESERLAETSSNGDDPSKRSRYRKSKPVIPEGGWTAAEESAQARGVFAERVEQRGFVRKVPEFVKSGGKRGVPERRYGAGGDEWARREAKWFGDGAGFQQKRGADAREDGESF